MTAVAGGQSAHLAGLLVPLPVITAVLAGFTQTRQGRAAAIDFLSGLVLALVSFLAFFVVLATLLGHAAVAPSFVLATFAAMASWGCLVGLRLRRAKRS